MVGTKLQPVARASHPVEVLNGVIQPAGGPYNRHGAILEAVNLIQPAGFIG